MDNSNNSTKIAAVVAIILFLGALIWGGWNKRLNNNLISEVNTERLRNEELLSEKLLIEKNLATSYTQLEDLADKNETLSRQIEEATTLGNLRDGTIQQLRNQLSSNKKKYNEIAGLNQEMEKKISWLKQEIGQVQDERLISARETENLRNQLDNLKRELAMAHNAYYDKVLVESTRGKKDRLVVKAARARKLKATIVIPSGLKDVQFQIFDPSGKLISTEPANGTLAVRINETDHSIASASNTSSVQTYKQAEMTFLPKRKLVAGTYRIEVLSENLSIGSLQMRLR